MHDPAVADESEIAAVLPTCVRCGRPVRRNQANYETSERMHWACFHYEFEHNGGAGDPDEAEQCLRPVDRLGMGVPSR